AKVFHAGTKLDGEQVATSGGRVLCATALGNNVTEAQQKAYQLAQNISWEGMFYRDDIAYRAIAREQQS
ncbi:phosphoribosylglycinamide synthetase C domain-containing protein, partial [Oleiphilus sp. HI0123]